MKKTISKTLLGVALVFGLTSAISVPAFAQNPTPTAVPPYVLSVFATAPAGLSAPDSVAVLGDQVFVGYGDGHAAGRFGRSEQPSRPIQQEWPRRSYLYCARPQRWSQNQSRNTPGLGVAKRRRQSQTW